MKLASIIWKFGTQQVDKSQISTIERKKLLQIGNFTLITLLDTKFSSFTFPPKQHSMGLLQLSKSGTKSPYWRANDGLGHVKESHQIWIFFVQHVPVRHLLSSMAILYHVIAQLQMAHFFEN